MTTFLNNSYHKYVIMKKELQLLLYSSFFFNLAQGLLGPIYALFVEDIGGDIVAAGTSYAIFSIVCGIFIIYMSRWEDKANNLSFLFFISRVLCTISIIGYFFIQTVWQLYVVQFILGIALALGNPPFDSLYSRHVDSAKITSEWGLWEAQYQIVLGISALLGGWIVYLTSFKVLIVCMFILSLIGTLYAYRLYRKSL